jgi:tetratricopeptide (TPR) repeat protein
MTDKKNKQKKVFMYAVVLFTCALIVLLVTAYSQYKLNKNIESSELEISKYQLSYAKALERIDELSEENDRLNDENKEQKENYEELKETAKIQNEEYNKQIEQYELMIEAYREFQKGDEKKSAEILYQVDNKLLNNEGNDFYNEISPTIFEKVGRILFNEGLDLYLKGKYQDSLDILNISRKYSKDADYSARCLYYIAHAQNKLNDKTAAIENMKKVIEEYPDSKYQAYAQSFLRENSTQKGE